MNATELFDLSKKNRQAAMKVVADSRIVEIWEGVGATVHMVGSVKSGLIMKNRDVDFHVYSGDPMTDKSFAAIAVLEKNPAVQDILFKNLLDTEEECLEWHIGYQDSDGKLWKIDVIHIRKGSAYDGVIEKTTDAIIGKLTPETREAILRIKYDMPKGMKTMGIEIYYAVLASGVRNFEEFARWKNANPDPNLLGWIP